MGDFVLWVKCVDCDWEDGAVDVVPTECPWCDGGVVRDRESEGHEFDIELSANLTSFKCDRCGFETRSLSTLRLGDVVLMGEKDCPNCLGMLVKEILAEHGSR